ncbi:MAG: tRNA (adenosine(37)-N6)-threonylcarbamoyltransferase complex dimerization subunit type 1 TsaB [Anaerovoracaceae bacterium]|jgi:tRNA threonylcarbamoyladenosine biosynthesis protein TsaB
MNILAIETTGPFASVALINENKDILEQNSQRKLSHLQNLIPMVGNLLEKSQLQIDDITHIAVSEGPGSFTGIRIGMATAKALAQTLNIPVIAVPTLKSFLWNVLDFNGIYCPIFDARRNQVYAGAYYWKDGTYHQAVTDGAYQIEDFFSLVEVFDPNHEKQIMMFGDGLSVYKNAVEDWKNNAHRLSSKGDLSVIIAEEGVRYQKASSVGLLAYSLCKEGKIINYEELRPVYIRKPEAERKLEERKQRELKNE